MAIVSISRIQHRRGLYADLPANLNEAEFGWCLDTRQLFIGNGNTYTGNSQILTQWSPNDDIITHIYHGYTGNAANTAVNGSPTVRTLGAIIDDYLSVKDYGAAGDGLTDDTAAIQQAITDEWQRIADAPASALMSRNTIFFPSGTYLISSPIKLYPFTSLRGEGINRTSLLMSAGNAGPVIETADSLGQTGSNIGTNSGVVPTDITVTGMTLDNSVATSGKTVALDRCQRVSLIDCEVINSWMSGDGGGTSLHGVVIQSLGTGVTTGDISIIGCQIHNAEYGVYAGDPISKITMVQSTISQCLAGAIWSYSLDGAVDQVNVSGCNIEDIDALGMVIGSPYSVTSMGNNYRAIGSTAVYMTSVALLGQSLGDTFDTSILQAQVYTYIPGVNLIWGPQQTGLVTNTPRALVQNINANQVNQATGIGYDLSGISLTFTAFIDYSLNLDAYRKSGRLTIISDGTTAAISDASTELNMTASVVFSVSIASGALSVNYTSTGTTSGLMQYIHTYWTT